MSYSVGKVMSSPTKTLGPTIVEKIAGTQDEDVHVQRFDFGQVHKPRSPRPSLPRLADVSRFPAEILEKGKENLVSALTFRVLRIVSVSYLVVYFVSSPKAIKSNELSIGFKDFPTSSLYHFIKLFTEDYLMFLGLRSGSDL
ncbi:hypothetical protein V6N13_059946 [Hibiscus sabdariffa]|uniref:Uncharacterized protein n=1 Tax=Hibiscus sabdariffa TaxID=183260 RepID=A0ABR2GBP4_9ROSI